ncbi:MAG: dehydrogenase E1 component subunit alpha/beta [Saprospiraceae bacterium]|nr:dehydrogenase E1 component subunit alpha/beta [Saprospiraceae bacterium]
MSQSLVEYDLSFDRTAYSNEELLSIYKHLLLPRLIEERMLISLRQGKISKWFSAWGQEAISVGAALAMHPDEFICTMHRNLGVFTTRHIPLERLFAQWQGKESGFTKGRDRSFHFGTHEFNIVGMISHLGAQMGVADGIALAQKLKGNQKATLVFTGDGGASEGDFHEAVNLAAVWDLPVLIIVENNQWGLSTPSKEQFRCESFADKGIGYGIEAHRIDGNNILEVHQNIGRLADSIRENPRPILLECVSFRMRGHEEASGTKYYPEGLIEQWEVKDPVKNFEYFLIQENVLTADENAALKDSLKAKINAALTEADSEPKVVSRIEKEVDDVFAPFQFEKKIPQHVEFFEMRFVDAIADGLQEAMKRHDNLVLMGQDIAEYGGVFKITDGLHAKYGSNRVRNTPICEAAVLGAGLGMSIAGMKSMVEMQFSDFVTEGFNQIVNNLAKSHYRWGQAADVVVRMPTGGGVAAGPFHSQSTEAWFTHVPGLKIAYPAFPDDAKGLLLTAFEDQNPVLFFEHKYLYRTLKGQVPKGYYNLPFGKANRLKEGNDLSIITYGLGVHYALEILEKHPNIAADLIDLRTLIPLDTDTIYESVRKTGKAIILHEDSLTGGFGAELSARISEHCFEDLDAPVMRVGSLDTPVPFDPGLEQQFLPKARFEERLLELYDY